MFRQPEIQNFSDYKNAYSESLKDPETFWGRVAGPLHWMKKWDRVTSGSFEKADYKYFEGAQTNLAYNCLDRHLPFLKDKTAIIFEPNDPKETVRKFSYEELHREVCRFSNVLLNLGVKKGDRVCLYMPMVPEAAFAMLACARIGAIHSVVFGGFSAKALADRINNSECSILLTADGAHRGQKEIPLKKIADDAMALSPGIKKALVLHRTKTPVEMKPGRDIWWHDALEGVSDQHEAQIQDAEDPLFILYTSGSTGKPKGILHTTAGYMVWVDYTFRNVFQIQEDEIYWCSADVGWITGHSYVVYAPLLNGVTTVMFEGVPNYPDPGRFWDVIDKHRVTIFYTAPTAIRALEKEKLSYVQNKDLSSLRVLGSVGEPINREAWNWYNINVGRERCPIVDTWWQTETGGIMISPLAGITESRPTYATYPLPGVDTLLVDEQGKELITNPKNPKDLEGNLCIRKPWPGAARTTWGDHELFKNTYFSTYPGLYFTGDGARRDADGMLRITGRVDDVINVSGHRMSTAEVESALDQHPQVVETAVVGYPHEIKGQGIYAFVITHCDPKDAEKYLPELEATVRDIIGPLAKPDKIQFVEGLPKTRSGKIMRRILRKIAEGHADQLGDTSTLLDPSIVEKIKDGLKL